MSRRSRKRTIVVVATVIGVLVLAIAAWGIDSSVNSGKVSRHVELFGHAVGGQTPDQLRQTISQVADEYQGAAVRITSPKGTLETTAAAVGLSLDQPETVQATIDLDRDQAVVQRPATWAAALVQSRPAPARFRVDPTLLMAGLHDLDMANRVAPVEPDITATDSGLESVPGKKGAAIDPMEVANQLRAAAEQGTTPVVIDVHTKPTNPRFSDADAKAVAARGNSITTTPLALSVGGRSATVQPKTVRSWLGAAPGANSLELQVDQAKVVAALPTLVTDLGTAPVNAGVTLVHDDAAKADVVQIVDGQNGTRCCAADSAQRIATALLNSQTSVTLDLEPIPPAHDRAWAEALQIAEPIATFTTKHPPPVGLDRVTNIHHIADATRGMIIEPGQEFSVNDRVGQRTEAKGYVDAPVIYDAQHDHDIGGGVSQFATTLFNAAFFGGLDLLDYQSHSIAIDRYPYGREATISWPKPDLKLRNNTPYGIMIWTSYTDTSLTVTLYSTPFVHGEQTGQSKEPKGPCTKVTTERTRTWASDGHTEVDRVYALYQPDYGIACP